MTLMRQNAVGFSWRTPSRWSTVDGVQSPQAAQARLALTAAASGGESGPQEKAAEQGQEQPQQTGPHAGGLPLLSAVPERRRLGHPG